MSSTALAESKTGYIQLSELNLDQSHLYVYRVTTTDTAGNTYQVGETTNGSSVIAPTWSVANLIGVTHVNPQP